MTETPKRIDLEIIVSLVEPKRRVLDIGSGNGDLLALLQEKRKARGVGVELSQEGVSACVARGLNVIKGDAETELQNYPNQAFDYVILSHTLQAMHQPAEVLRQMLRIGKVAIVSFPNFAYWSIRWGLFWSGKMPHSPLLPYHWYDTPNIHLCSIRDFVEFTKEKGIKISRFVPISAKRRRQKLRWLAFANWFAPQAIFVLQLDEKK